MGEIRTSSTATTQPVTRTNPTRMVPPNTGTTATNSVGLANQSSSNQVAVPQGTARGTQPLVAEPPLWSAKTKTNILASYSSGLKQFGVQAEELNRIIIDLGLGNLQISADSIQNPENADDIQALQEQINAHLKQMGDKHSVGTDGQFGKGTIEALVALRDSQRGEPVTLKLTPIKQQTRTGCFMASEAMAFNVMHGKDGTDEAYTEFDARDRIKIADRDRKLMAGGVTSETSAGKVTFSRSYGQKMLTDIDNSLNQGVPIVTGVSYRKQNGVEYNEGKTDHYVAIYGRGQDEKGTFYLFADPAQGGQGKLRLDPFTLKLSGEGDMGNYDVTMTSQYTDTDTATVEHYKNIGKLVHYSGQKGPEISQMQLRLSLLGYETKGTAGSFNATTTAALKQFQEAQGLPVTGNLDTRTQTRLEAEFYDFQVAKPEQVIFKKGTNSPDLNEIQGRLNKLGYKTGGIGTFGNNTESALKAFQTAQKLPVTGVVDNQTWLALQKQ